MIFLNLITKLSYKLLNLKYINFSFRTFHGNIIFTYSNIFTFFFSIFMLINTGEITKNKRESIDYISEVLFFCERN